MLALVNSKKVLMTLLFIMHLSHKGALSIVPHLSMCHLPTHNSRVEKSSTDKL